MGLVVRTTFGDSPPQNSYRSFTLTPVTVAEPGVSNPPEYPLFSLSVDGSKGHWVAKDHFDGPIGDVIPDSAFIIGWQTSMSLSVPLVPSFVLARSYRC